MFKTTPYIFFSKKKQAEVYGWLFESTIKKLSDEAFENIFPYSIPPVVEEKRPWEYDYHCEIKGDFAKGVRKKKKYPLDNFFIHTNY